MGEKGVVCCGISKGPASKALVPDGGSAPVPGAASAWYAFPKPYEISTLQDPPSFAMVWSRETDLHPTRGSLGPPESFALYILFQRKINFSFGSQSWLGLLGSSPDLSDAN